MHCLIKHQAMKTYWRSGGIPPGKVSPSLMDRELVGGGGAQSRSERGDEDKNSEPLPGIEPRSSSP
jgi:hypothetical protein